MNPIPYRGVGPALTDVIAGNVGLMVDGLPSSIGYHPRRVAEGASPWPMPSATASCRTCRR